MSKVCLRTTMAGPNGTFLAGSTINVSAEQAEALVAGGFAAYAAGPPDQAQVSSAPETATAPRTRAKSKSKEDSDG